MNCVLDVEATPHILTDLWAVIGIRPIQARHNVSFQRHGETREVGRFRSRPGAFS
jgi:hypothetical protein